jgi:hypothetical protein
VFNVVVLVRSWPLQAQICPVYKYSYFGSKVERVQCFGGWLHCTLSGDVENGGDSDSDSDSGPMDMEARSKALDRAATEDE